MHLQQRMATTDNTPIAVLYRRHAPTILRSIRRSITSPEDAEDVLLEVFLAALENDALSKFSDGEQLAWLRRVAHNKCVDLYRRAHHRSAITLDEVTESMYDDDERMPEQMALRREEHALLHSHLARLPELQQEVLRLRFAAGLRCAEIATVINKSEGAVRMILSRSLNLLRDIYERQ